ncbi:MAG: hypothetical protein D6690_13570 [Nitrospirae bacterium]|nr:MAG: hypothetical protein D6690_13570 [Nitrospirota bacterium]
MYLDYEHLGESSFLGFPTRTARPVPGGTEQIFQGGRMYHRAGEPTAYEVHGAILAKYIATGSVRKWGFPVTNESDVKKNDRVIGKFSEFEHATIYWSGRTGAHEVHGDIHKKYQDLNGPLGNLGFPTSDEADIPRHADAGRMNTFESASLLWYGSWNSMIVARPFTIFLGRIHSRESEGFLMGQNDLYCYVKVRDGGRTLYNKRHPCSGDWGGRNIKDVNLTIPATIVPNKLNQRIIFSVDIWDADPGKDDHLGKYTKELHAANGWGLRENNGVYRVGSFSKIRSLTWSVKPKIDPKTLSETEKFWGVANKGTKTLTWSQHASAFRDVDSETEWWDITDWLDKAFYELVVEDLASNGNCFGMSLEAIYVRKQSSIYSLPINRFTKWESVRREFNIKHCYQVGAGPIWWFLGEFVTGNTHDPKDVFTRIRREFERGNHPVLCLSQDYDFSRAPHCILPVAWDSSRKPWCITICNPNFHNTLKELTVDPDRNRFEYRGSSTYRGGEWRWGRLHYMPFSKLCTAPRTPVWDAILLILTGTIIILGDDAQTESITDARGNDLDAFGTRARQMLQAGRRLDEFFVPFKGYDHPRLRPTSGLSIRPVRPSVGLARPGRVRQRIRGKGTVDG